MDDKKRIQELEAEVERLRRTLNELDRPGDGPSLLGHDPRRGDLVESFRDGLAHAFDDGDDSLEVRVGGVWLGHVALVLVMTVMALIAAAALVRTGTAEPWQRVAAGFGVALGGLGIGWYGRSSNRPSLQALFGFGIAAFFFTLYGVFFIEATQLIASPEAALFSLAGGLAVVILLSLLRHSAIAAAIGLFFVFYTLVASCTYNRDAGTLLYALLGAGALSLATAILHAIQRWRAITFLVMLGVYSIVALFLWEQPVELAFETTAYQGLLIVVLTVSFFSFAGAGLVDAWRSGILTRTMTVMAGLNVFACLILIWGPIGAYLGEGVWAFRIVAAAALALLAGLAYALSSPRNLLPQFYAACSLALFVAALPLLLTPARLQVALALVALGLAVLYAYTGRVAIKLLGVAALGVVVVGCLQLIPTTGVVLLGGTPIAANWFAGGAAAIILLAGAWIYTHMEAPPHRRYRAFLESTWLDMSHGVASALYAGAAALILLTVASYSWGDDRFLPFRLGLLGVAVAVLGLLSFTPSIQAAACLFFLAAHVALHFLLWMDAPMLTDHADYLLNAVLLTLGTLGAGLLWERYARANADPKSVPYHIVVAVPFLLAAYLAYQLAAGELMIPHGPLAMNGLGIALLVLGAIIGCAGPLWGGILLVGIGAYTYFDRLEFLQEMLAPWPFFILHLAAFLCIFATGERLLFLLTQRNGQPTRLVDAMRTLLVAGSGVMGIVVLSHYIPDSYLTVAWLVHAAGGMLIGVGVSESRYRWAALLIFAMAIVRGFLHDLRLLPLVYQLLTFVALLVVIVAVSRLYMVYRTRGGQPRDLADEEPAADG